MGMMGKIASSITTTTGSWKNTIVTATIVFAVRLYAKVFRHSTMLNIYHPNPRNKDMSSAAFVPYCVVCLQEVMKGQRCRKLPICNHCFHVHCIDTWFQSHSTCPLCRTNQASFVHTHQLRLLRIHLLFSFIFRIFSRENV
ncbi:hypothetical protein GBA52_007928 [Prunus armeniaca]|nr:hypothetical protein GBA52_007928 [Prunus armeniaca]